VCVATFQCVYVFVCVCVGGCMWMIGRKAETGEGETSENALADDQPSNNSPRLPERKHPRKQQQRGNGSINISSVFFFLRKEVGSVLAQGRYRGRSGSLSPPPLPPLWSTVALFFPLHCLTGAEERQRKGRE
jgi:hypothetical protein